MARRLSPRFIALVIELHDWHDAERDAEITLTRADVIALMEGIATLQLWAGDNDR
jgi:hypothetical protein